MTRDDIRAAVLRLLGAIAPEADLTRLDPRANLREELDIDSMDFLNLMVAIHKQLGVEVPEKDYAKVATLAGCVDYVAARLPVS
jgi:acyl carrier protein